MSIKNFVKNNPKLVEELLSGHGSYDLDEAIWDYYYDNGTIKNYNCVDLPVGLYEQFLDEVKDAVYELEVSP
jgi:hypothetical protein